jgi:DNA-binding IclR family transcriptional regulator
MNKLVRLKWPGTCFAPSTLHRIVVLNALHRIVVNDESRRESTVILCEESTDSKGKYIIQVIVRAISVLEVLAQNPHGLTLDQVSDIVDLHRATVYRILTTLEQGGVVERTEDRPIKYALGLRCFYPAVRMLEEKAIMAQTQTILEDVTVNTGESAGLYLRWGEGRICVASSKSVYPPMYRIEVGQVFPLCSGSAGKLLLAYMPYEEAKAILEKTLPFIRRYPGTPSAVDIVLKELNDIRSKGFSISAHELSFDAKSIAVPVVDSNNRALAALGVTVKADRLPDARIPVLAEELNAASRRLQCLLHRG